MICPILTRHKQPLPFVPFSPLFSLLVCPNTLLSSPPTQCPRPQDLKLFFTSNSKTDSWKGIRLIHSY